jgi:DNA transposition AAA+ family ATPase
MANTRHAGESGGDRFHEAHGADNPAVEAGMSRDSLNIPANVVLEGIRDYSQEDQDDLLWLAGHAREVLGGSRRAVCEALGCDYTTFTRVLTGKYPAGIGNFMQAVRHLRAKASQPGGRFVETVVTRKIFATLDQARDFNAVVHVCGPSGRSKTESVKEWIRRNSHGRCFYIDCPVVGGARGLMEEIARKAGVNVARKSLDIATRLEKSFDWRHVLIIDEAVRLIPQGRGREVKPLEFLRRLHDVTTCGMAFVSTDVFRREMESGAISDFLEQLMGRIEDPLYIPEKVGLQEAGDVCRAFNPDADVECIRLAAKIANGRGRIRVLFHLVRQAAMLAQKKGEPMATAHLKAACALRDNLHRWPEE